MLKSGPSNRPAMRGFGGNTQFSARSSAAALAMPNTASLAAEPITASTRLLGFYALAFIIPIAEILVVYLHAHIPVVIIADAILTVILLTTGRIGAFWSSPSAKPWMAMLVLFAAAAVFGFYPGRSVPFIFTYGSRFHIFPFYCCAIALNTKQIRHVMSWIAWGSFLLLFLCLKFGQLMDGRLAIPDTDLGNPNDLGLAILIVMGALLVLKGKISRAIVLIAVPIFVLEILKTGSRACLVTLICVTLMLFTVVSTRVRILLLILLPIGGGVIVATVPSFTLSRLTLIVADTRSRSTNDDQLNAAIDSQAARTELQKHAMQLAMRHPLLGVGAQNLEDAVDEMVRGMTGKKSGWQGAHNSYLEVAGENGIPAMLFYVWSLILSIRMNYKSYKLCRNTAELLEAAPQSLALLVMTAVFAVCTTFSNNAYSPPICLLVGLSAANFFAVQKESKELAPVAPTSVPAPVRKPVMQRPARYPAPSYARPDWRA